jgi:magnesium transporter
VVVIVDSAVYEKGVRIDTNGREVDVATIDPVAGGFVWLGLHEPTHDEFELVAETFKLHPLAVEDAVHAHQRPKVERYGDSWFVVVKTASYVDSREVVRLGEVMMFVGDRFLVTVRHGEACDLATVRRQLEDQPERLALGPFAVVHAVLDSVVDDYTSVNAAVALDIDQIQADVFSGDRSNHAERIFRLKREVLEFRQAVDPLVDALDHLHGKPHSSPIPTDLHEYLRDVTDHLKRANDRIAAHDMLLSEALDANVAQVSMRQNEDMRKISAWVAIVSVPTMIAGVYGMNFDHMPELGARFGYPIVLGMMVCSCFALYRNFKRRGWL